MNCQTSPKQKSRNQFEPQLFRLMNELSMMETNHKKKVAKPSKTFNAAANVLEYEDFYNIQISLPGYHKEEVNISIDKDHLMIKAQLTENKEENYRIQEFAKTEFERKFKLGNTVETNNIEAAFQNGILNIKLIKKEEQKPKQITID